MSLVFPLTREAFLDKLPVKDVQFSCPTQRQNTGLGSGEILGAELAPALWIGSVSLVTMPARAAAEIEALLQALDVPGRSFLAYKKNQIGPASDPVGAALSGYAPQIKAIDEPGSRLQLDNLPAGYEISVGDYLSFNYGSSPVRRALHRVQEAVTADEFGEIGDFQITPHLRGGAAIGAAVELVKPYCKAVIVPGSINYGRTSMGKTSGISFQFRQSLR